LTQCFLYSPNDTVANKHLSFVEPDIQGASVERVYKPFRNQPVFRSMTKKKDWPVHTLMYAALDRGYQLLRVLECLIIKAYRISKVRNIVLERLS
jgi:hypothetical protein